MRGKKGLGGASVSRAVLCRTAEGERLQVKRAARHKEDNRKP